MACVRFLPNCSKYRISHSHTTITRQPSPMSMAWFFWSRCTVLSNFGSQYSRRVAGVDALEHPGWRCQKQPWINMTVRYLGKTISGLPGRSLRCSRNRNPSPWSKDRTFFSGVVSVDRTRLIISERFSGLKVSKTAYPMEINRLGSVSVSFTIRL
jgi:hypothetical protein